MTRAASSTSAPTVTGLLAVLDAIERHPAGSPAAHAFRAALRRMGLEADAAGGLIALDGLMHAAADAEPDQGEARLAVLRAAWTDLLPGVPRWPASTDASEGDTACP